ncbi:MAG: hypothetical protein NT096_09470 [Proteobacteria bacterium]|nr:hypothetical protein [Pseudomonadota bacterium]
MKNRWVIFILTFFVGLTLNANLMAEEETDVDIDMWKSVYSHGDYYSIGFHMSGDIFKNIKYVVIDNPNGNKTWLKNAFGHNSISLEKTDMTYEEFNNEFPEGKYNIRFIPRSYGGFKKNLTYNFPPTPEITYPADGATNVPLSFTITWNPVWNEGLELRIEGEDFVYELDPESDATSYTIPTGILQGNTQYDIILEAQTETQGVGDIGTERIISITTASQ